MSNLLAKPKTPSALRRGNLGSGSSAASSATPSDQKPREVKSAPYLRVSYAVVLATKGSFMEDSLLGLTNASSIMCQSLLETNQPILNEGIFRDGQFQKACRKILNKNEARVIQDVSRHLVPSAETLETQGAAHLEHLIESVNEGWNSSIPFYGSRPQPDYSVGFRRASFTNEQLEKLMPYTGEIVDDYTSYFMGTMTMYFPFFTCEVKCGAAALAIADRQNAHSMTLAVRGVVELYREVKREKELDREILAFSVSHDDRHARIYGHYASIDGDKTTFHCHLIHDFNFTVLKGKEKWTCYRFTENVYNIWMPMHFARIRSAIDDLPLSQQSEPQLQNTPDVEVQQEAQPSQEARPPPESGVSSQPMLFGSQTAMPDMSSSENAPQSSKRPRT